MQRISGTDLLKSCSFINESDDTYSCKAPDNHFALLGNAELLLLKFSSSPSRKNRLT